MTFRDEAEFTAVLLKKLRGRRALKGAWIPKLNDGTTGGVPDFCVALKGTTTWFEDKVETGKLSLLQADTLKRIGRAYVVTWDRPTGAWWVERAPGLVTFKMGRAHVTLGADVSTGMGMDMLVEQLEAICLT